MTNQHSLRFRDVDSELRSRGFVLVRKTKHIVWRHPDGTIVSLPSKPQTDVLQGPVVKRIFSKEKINA